MYDENNNDYTEDSSRQATEFVEKQGEKAIKKAVRKVSQAVKSIAKQLGKKMVQAGQAAVKALIAKFGIPIAIGLAVFFLCLIIFGAMGDVLFEERGTAQSFSLETKEDNLSGVDPNDGVRKVVALAEPQALKTAYYRLMSCASYSKQVGDKKFVFYDPLEKDKDKMKKMREDFATLQDMHKQETKFLLSADFLMMADEILHDYTIYYPEQIIKPVYHKEETDDQGRTVVKTQTLVDEETHDLKPEVVSKGYDPLPEGGFKNKTNNKDQVGLWDYGLGSVLTYESGEKNVKHEGKILWREVCEHEYDAAGNITKHTVKKVEVNESFSYDDIPLKGEDVSAGKRKFNDSELDKKFGNDTTTYPIKVPVISSAALFSGTVIYQYEVEESKIPFQEGTTTDKKDAVASYVYKKCGDNELHEYREGNVVTTAPSSTGEDKDVLGFDYIDQYYSKYTNYAPIGLKNDLNFESRTTETYDLLQQLGLLKLFNGEIKNIMSSQGSTVPGTGISVSQPADGAASLAGAAGNLNDSNSDYKTWNDLTMLAHLIEAEAGNSKLDELMVGAVAFNRWKSGKWGSTLFDVITAPGQYACYNKTNGGTWASKTPTERVVESAKQIISGEFAIPANIIFQAQFTQGPVFMEVSPHYYCYKQGETLADKDAFGRTALSAAQLKSRASQLDGAGSTADSINSPGNPGVSVGEALGGKKTVEVTYYCAACNSPPGSDAIAWSGGPSKGHATVGTTCAMSKGSMAALGVEFGDWIYIEGVGTRRVEDICGTGYGGVSGLKTDRIVVDVYCDSPGGVCKCIQQKGMSHTTAYKTSGEGATNQVGMYSSVSGLYYSNIGSDVYVDVIPTYHLYRENEDGTVNEDMPVLFDASAFNAYKATKENFEKIADDQQTWYQALSDGIKAIIDNAIDFFKSIITSVFVEDVFESDRFYVVPPSDLEKTHDVVYQALANSQYKQYSEIVANFDESNMDLLFVGDAGNIGGMLNAGFGIVNGVGSSVEGFVSPTTTYYQPLIPYSSENPTVTLATPKGTTVQAIYSGTITKNDPDVGMVVIEHTGKDGKKYTVTYGNIEPSISSLGTVSKEQTLGTTKEGGLQLKVLVDGKAVDPMSIFYQSSYSFDSTGLVQFALNEVATEAPAKYGLKYKAEFGISNKGTAWCAIFVGYCAQHVGLIDADLYPSTSEINIMWVPDVWDWFKNKNWYRTVGNGYTPKPGDAVFFDFDGNGRPEHIGIVEYWDGSKLHSIEGNTTNGGESSVLAKKARSNYYGVIGFGVIGGA